MLEIITEMLVFAMVCALFAAFVVIFLGKTGIRGKIIERSRVKLISELFSCDFCLCFWVSVFISMLAAIIFGNIILLTCAAMSAPVARALL